MYRCRVVPASLPPSIHTPVSLNLKYRQAIVTIEEKYNKKEKELSRKEKKIVKEIIKKAKDNPDEINNKIEELFGFTSGS